MRGKLALLVLALSLRSAPSHAQTVEQTQRSTANDEQAEADERGGGLGAFPILAYAPETSGMFGAFVVYHFDSPKLAGPARPDEETAKRSSLRTVAFYTLKKQYVVALAPTVYLGNDWRLSGEIALSYFPDTFYPVGPGSRESDAEDYTQRSVSGSVNIERKLFSHLSTGVHIVATDHDVLKVEPGGELASGQVLGAAGGQTLQAGPSIVWDSRERDFAARYGARHQIAWLVAPPVLGGDYGYSELLADLRQYVGTVGGQVLALQLYAQTAWHRVPFQGLAPIGGDGRMRGYFARRYHDRAGVSGQVEYRVPLFWRLGAVGFVGAGNVAPSLFEFRSEYLRYVGGMGLRGALNAKDGVNLRLDFGMTGEGTRNVYFQVGEAF